MQLREHFLCGLYVVLVDTRCPGLSDGTLELGFVTPRIHCMVESLEGSTALAVLLVSQLPPRLVQQRFGGTNRRPQIFRRCTSACHHRTEPATRARRGRATTGRERGSWTGRAPYVLQGVCQGLVLLPQLRHLVLQLFHFPAGFSLQSSELAGFGVDLALLLDQAVLPRYHQLVRLRDELLGVGQQLLPLLAEKAGGVLHALGAHGLDLLHELLVTGRELGHLLLQIGVGTGEAVGVVVVCAIVIVGVPRRSPDGIRRGTVSLRRASRRPCWSHHGRWRTICPHCQRRGRRADSGRLWEPGWRG
mmetsp:Transcript_44636/g.129877  ORF Transcript_44636/g.129877 Transcript_44636/m.129877 type:complete len:304 (-) Transcript_44636:185-1096(-)